MNEKTKTAQAEQIQVRLKHDVEYLGVLHLAGTSITVPRHVATWLQDNGHI